LIWLLLLLLSLFCISFWRATIFVVQFNGEIAFVFLLFFVVASTYTTANAANSSHLRARFLHVCASVANSPQLLFCLCECYTRTEMTCALWCAFCRACVLITFAVPFWRPTRTHSHATMSNCTHTPIEWKRRAFCEHPLAPSPPPPVIPPLSVYHLLPHCWLRRCSVVIGYQSERKTSNENKTIARLEALTANLRRSLQILA